MCSQRYSSPLMTPLCKAQPLKPRPSPSPTALGAKWHTPVHVEQAPVTTSKVCVVAFWGGSGRRGWVAIHRSRPCGRTQGRGALRWWETGSKQLSATARLAPCGPVEYSAAAEVPADGCLPGLVDDCFSCGAGDGEGAVFVEEVPVSDVLAAEVFDDAPPAGCVVAQNDGKRCPGRAHTKRLSSGPKREPWRRCGI